MDQSFSLDKVVMYLSRIGLICLAIVAVVGFWIGHSLAHREKKYRENFGRVLPDSLRHPHNEPIQVIPARAAQTLSGLNEFVDQLMDSYFDQQGFPFNETRTYCLSKLQVPYPNSLVDPWTLSKLNDIGFYFIRHVIPKCATTSVAEQEAIAWPSMVWSTTMNMLQPGTNLSSGVGIFKVATDGGSVDGSDGKSTSDKNSSDSRVRVQRSISSGDESIATAAGSCSVNGPCGQPCPTSCIDAALFKSAAPAPAPATSPTQKGALTQNLDATDMAKWWSLFTEDQGGSNGSNGSDGSSSSSSSSSIRNIKSDHFPVGSPTDDKLDTYLKTEIINAYFDPITGIPTSKFIAKFRDYTQGQIPMDEAHQNKLIDMVFYVMETVVSGLPTKTKTSFDFTWRPIPRLSHRLPPTAPFGH